MAPARPLRSRNAAAERIPVAVCALLPSPSPRGTTRRHSANCKCRSCHRPSPQSELRLPASPARPAAPPPPPGARRPAPPLAVSRRGRCQPPSRGSGPARESPAPSPSDVAGAKGVQGRRRCGLGIRSSAEAVKSVSFVFSSYFSEVVLKVHPRDPVPSSRLPPGR